MSKSFLSPQIWLVDAIHPYYLLVISLLCVHSESQEGATLDQAVVKRTRKSTSEMSLNVSKDEVFTDNTR